MRELPLGKNTEYVFQYDNSLLAAIPRKMGRDIIGVRQNKLPFQGVDIWNCYEMCWLNPQGLPVIRILQIYVDCNSANIVESKSLKLYLNSFTNQKFTNETEVKNIIKQDLSKIIASDVVVQMHRLADFDNTPLSNFKAESIDEPSEKITITEYTVNKSFLTTDTENIVSEELCSNLLKSNCLVTNQPDWASVYINYTGPQINRIGLLKYIISFRNHSEFHEQCVEHIFNDILNMCSPQKLVVHAKYTRRGGIDINPFRTNSSYRMEDIDQMRGVRQ